VQFEVGQQQVPEAFLNTNLVVTRSGNPAAAFTVDFATSEGGAGVRCDAVTGQASERCDFETAIGTLRFAAGEMRKEISVFLWDDAHVEGNETFTVTLSNAVGATIFVFGGTNTVTITDNDAAASNSNPTDADEFFVRMQYLDFLYREPEVSGRDAWLGVLRGCPNQFNRDPRNDSARCDRVRVSSSFFRSTENFIKGYSIIRFYRVSFARLPTYREFARDLRRVTGSTAEEVNAALAAYADEFAARADFRSRYDAKSNDAYVDELQANVGVQLPNAQALKNDLNQGRKTRAQVLREIVESRQVDEAEFNRGFVATQYFGYLRRDPEQPGFSAWLDYLNANPQDFYVMVSGFVNSQEYRLRFGRE
jgi:hypothetical protein